MGECRRNAKMTARLLERKGTYDVLEFWYGEHAVWVQGIRPSAWWNEAQPCDCPEVSV